MQSKTENRVKRVAVYSDYLALQCGLIGYTIDTINGRHEKSCLPFLRQCAASSSAFEIVGAFRAIAKRRD